MFASARVPAKPPKSKKLGPKKQALLDKKLAKERYEIKLTSRALRSSLKRMYYPIPRSWGAGIDCDRPLLDDVAFAVAIATDEDDMLPIFAAINSTATNLAFAGKDAQLLPFVVFTKTSARAVLLDLVRTYVEPMHASVRVSVCVGLAAHLAQRPAMRTLALMEHSSRVKRKELLSSFNFAAFYLPQLLKAKRVLYMDSDVIVRGDVGELARMDMRGNPAAAVEDCSQLLGRYVDFAVAEAYRVAAEQRIASQGCGNSSAPQAWAPELTLVGEGNDDDGPIDDPTPLRKSRALSARADLADDECEPQTWTLPNAGTCVFNRGVLLLDRAMWIEERVTERIERIVIEFAHSRGTLFRSGVSQPPFLLALAHRYTKLAPVWNIRGLGRDSIGVPEWGSIAREATKDFPRLSQIGPSLEKHLRAIAALRHKAHSHPSTVLAFQPAKNVYEFHHNLPYLCPSAWHAKILHFNGEVKPWRMQKATILQPEPVEGALCLWTNISGDLLPLASPHVEAVCDDASRRASCVSSCARDWLQYVQGVRRPSKSSHRQN